MRRRRRPALELAFFALVTPTLAGLLIVSEPPVEARQVFDSGDPAFDGAVVVPMPPLPLGQNDFSFDYQASGVNFRFESLSNVGLGGFGAGGDGLIVYGFGADGGVLVTASPPVAAIGFRGTPLDGCPGGTFLGAQATEAVVSSCIEGDFFGAADIGPIGSVRLHRMSSIFLVTEMVFVPGGTMVTSSDLGVDKTESRGSPGAALNGEALHYDIGVVNDGPDEARDVVVTDLLPPTFVLSDVSANGVYDADNNLVRFAPGDFPVVGPVPYAIDGFTPASRREFSCDFRMTNVVTVGSASADPALADNVSVATTAFDNFSVRDLPEICGDGIGDACDAPEPLVCDIDGRR